MVEPDAMVVTLRAPVSTRLKNVVEPVKVKLLISSSNVTVLAPVTKLMPLFVKLFEIVIGELLA